MSECCPTCGAEQPDRVQRFGLIVQRAPAEVYWRGIRTKLPSSWIRTLYPLVQRGQASYFALELLTTREGTSTGAVQVRICQLRRWLRERDPAFSIRCEVGWGYVLEYDKLGSGPRC